MLSFDDADKRVLLQAAIVFAAIAVSSLSIAAVAGLSVRLFTFFAGV